MNIKSLCLVGALFMLVDVNASEHPKDLALGTQNANSATSNLSVNQVQENSHQQIEFSDDNEQFRNPQTTVGAATQNGNNELRTELDELRNLLNTYLLWLSNSMGIEQQNTYSLDNTEQTTHNMLDEEQYEQEYDIYQGWDGYNPAVQYWDPWQYWCPNCASSFFGIPER